MRVVGVVDHVDCRLYVSHPNSAKLQGRRPRGGQGGRSPPMVEVGGTESLISPPIYHESNYKTPRSPPIVAVRGGLGGRGAGSGVAGVAVATPVFDKMGFKKIFTLRAIIFNFFDFFTTPVSNCFRRRCWRGRSDGVVYIPPSPQYIMNINYVIKFNVQYFPRFAIFRSSLCKIRKKLNRRRGI